MTKEEVKQELAKIVANEGDDEAQHAMEDDLRTAVLKHIAAGGEDAAELAALALTTENMNFARWCA